MNLIESNSNAVFEDIAAAPIAAAFFANDADRAYAIGFRPLVAADEHAVDRARQTDAVLVPPRDLIAERDFLTADLDLFYSADAVRQAAERSIAAITRQVAADAANVAADAAANARQTAANIANAANAATPQDRAAAATLARQIRLLLRRRRSLRPPSRLLRQRRRPRGTSLDDRFAGFETTLRGDNEQDEPLIFKKDKDIHDQRGRGRRDAKIAETFDFPTNNSLN